MTRQIYFFDASRWEQERALTPLRSGDLAELRLVTSVPAPRLSLVPFRREQIAAIVLEGAVCADHLLEDAASLGGFRVQGALPVDYQPSWPAGKQTPGVALLTLFRRKPGLDQQAFLERWYQGHTPLSLQIHPLWRYDRNQVLDSLGENHLIPGLDGIVIEHFRQRGDLLNPLRMFGGPLRALPNMVRVWRDIHRFIDMKTIRTYLVRETILRCQEAG